MNLKEQIRNWIAQKDYKAIIEALTKLDPKELTDSLYLALGKAYVNYGLQTDDRMAFSKALNILSSFSQTLENNYEWCWNMGNCLYHLDAYGYAYRYFENAYEKSPRTININPLKDLLAECKMYMSIPYFQSSFYEKTKKAWEEIEQLEPEIRPHLENMEPPEQWPELYTELCLSLIKVMRGLRFLVLKEKGKGELVLSGENDLLRLFECQYFKEHAPESFTKNWDIQIGFRPGWFDGTPEVYGMNAEQQRKIQVAIQKEKGDIFNAYLEVLNSPFDPADVPEELVTDSYFSNDKISNVISNVIGEVPFTKYFANFVTFGFNNKNISKIKIGAIADYLKANGIDINLPAKEILDSKVKYTSTPRKGPIGENLRVDITTGETKCMKLLDEYKAGGQLTVNRLEFDSAIAGYFCYRHDCFTSSHKRKDRLEFRQNFIDELLSKGGEDKVEIIGVANGRYFDYVDVLLWDTTSVIEKAMDFFEKSPVKFSAFHVFRLQSGTLILTGEKYWQSQDILDGRCNNMYRISKDPKGGFNIKLV